MEEQLFEIITTVLENSDLTVPEKMTDETHLRDDLNFDSLALAELTVRVEEAFDIDIFEDGIVDTIQQIKTKINAAS